MEFVVVTMPLPDEVVKVPGTPPQENGGGTVASVNGVLPDPSKNVELTPADIGAEVAGAASTAENNAKAYADALVVGLWDDRGDFNASVNTYPNSGGSGPAGAILKGDIWKISVAGAIGNVNDTVRALTDIPGQTAANWQVSKSSTDKYRGYFDPTGLQWPTSGGSGVGGAIMAGDYWMSVDIGVIAGLAVNYGDRVESFVNNPTVNVPAQNNGQWIVTPCLDSTRNFIDAYLPTLQLLAAFVKNHFSNPSPIPHTGTTSETKLLSIRVPANTFHSLDQLKFYMRCVTYGGGGNKTFRVYFNPTDTLPTAGGAQQIGIYTFTTTALAFVRTFWFSNANTMQMQLRTSSVSNDEASSYSGLGHQASIAVDLTIDNYIIISGQLGTAGETMAFYATNLLLMRP